MRILFITRLFLPHIGGVEKQVSELSKRLIEKGFSISIITEKFDENLKDEEMINGAKVIRLSHPEIKFLGLIFIWLWLLRNIQHIRQADIIHTHGVFIWYWPLRFLFPKKPIYTTFHGWEGIYPIPRKNILLRKIAAKLSWGNICIGNFIEKHYGIKANKIIYTSVDIPKKIKFPKKRKNLVYIGRLDEDTGLRQILKSLSYLKGFRIDFCGDGSLRKECRKYGNTHGFVDPESFFEKAAICLSPGHTSILEAFTYKCLVITTYDNLVKRDYLKMTPFEKWIIIRKSPEEMAKKIKYYSKYLEEAKPMVEKAYDWVKTQNWDNTTELYLQLWGVK